MHGLHLQGVGVWFGGAGAGIRYSVGRLVVYETSILFYFCFFRVLITYLAKYIT